MVGKLGFFTAEEKQLERQGDSEVVHMTQHSSLHHMWTYIDYYPVIQHADNVICLPQKYFQVGTDKIGLHFQQKTRNGFT